MPWIMQMVGFALFLVGIGIALWISLWLLVALFAIGLIAVAWSHVKDFLLQKGILNPTPGVPPDVPFIEGSFTRVDTETVIAPTDEKSPR